MHKPATIQQVQMAQSSDRCKHWKRMKVGN